MKKLLKLGKLNNLKHCDPVLVVLITILTVFGVVMVFSASYYSAINTSGTPYSLRSVDLA